MVWDHTSNRSKASFWEGIGLDSDAATMAARCFPEHSWARYSGEGAVCNGKLICNGQPERDAAFWIDWSIREYGADARHPAFWIAQDYDLNEAAARAVAANAAVNLQREATPPPPPPPKPDRFAEVAQALLMQGAILQQLQGPHAYDDQRHDVARLPGPGQPPFDPDDYPRFRVE